MTKTKLLATALSTLGTGFTAAIVFLSNGQAFLPVVLFSIFAALSVFGFVDMWKYFTTWGER